MHRKHALAVFVALLTTFSLLWAAPATAGKKKAKKSFVEKNAPKVDKLLDEARELIETGEDKKLEKAVRKLEQARDLSRLEDPRPFFAIAEVLLLQGEPDRAAKNADRGLEVVLPEQVALAARGQRLRGEGYLGWYRMLEEESDVPPSPALAKRAEEGFVRALDSLTRDDARRPEIEARLREARELLGSPPLAEAPPEDPAKIDEPAASGGWLDGFGRPVSSVIERPAWGKHFEAAHVEGSFVLYDPASRKLEVYEPEEAARRTLPASTFKIPNTLIALETGVITDPDAQWEWDGTERAFDIWNRDHSLRTALPNSVVWFYQEVARRVGEERMQNWVDRFAYGNRDIGGGIDMFWLTGDLTISPLEQVDFLTRLQAGELPVSERSLSLLRELLVQSDEVIDPGEGWVVRAKTGWANAPDPDIAWYVGWAEKGSETRVFALRIEMDDPDEDRKHRVSLAETLLKLAISK